MCDEMVKRFNKLSFAATWNLICASSMEEFSIHSSCIDASVCVHVAECRRGFCMLRVTFPRWKNKKNTNTHTQALNFAVGDNSR